MFSPQDISHDLATSSSSIDLFEKLNAYSGELGFEYCCYGFRAPYMRTESNIKVYDTYPNSWMAHYQRRRYVDIDPTVSGGLTSPATILWPSTESSRLSSFWNDARDHGLAHGVAQPSWSFGGAFGLLSFARSRDEIHESEFEALSMKISWLANYAHSLMSGHLIAESGTSRPAHLTSREREVLLWTTEGLNASDIAKQLHISISTVNWHVARILSKLGAANKVQAASRAIALGLI